MTIGCFVLQITRFWIQPVSPSCGEAEFSYAVKQGSVGLGFCHKVGGGPPPLPALSGARAGCTTSSRYVSTGGTRCPCAPARTLRIQPDAHR